MPFSSSLDLRLLVLFGSIEPITVNYFDAFVRAWQQHRLDRAQSQHNLRNSFSFEQPPNDDCDVDIKKVLSLDAALSISKITGL